MCGVYVGASTSLAVDEVNGFVYFGLHYSIIIQVLLNGSSTEHNISTGKLNLHDCSRVVIV